MVRNDFNFDRIHMAQALIVDAQNDMMRCLHGGKVVDIVRDRMVQRLELAAEQLSKLQLDHG
jgi:glutathione synthase/RimK-type ligase-like ATP-grasp enzyme